MKLGRNEKVGKSEGCVKRDGEGEGGGGMKQTSARHAYHSYHSYTHTHIYSHNHTCDSVYHVDRCIVYTQIDTILDNTQFNFAIFDIMYTISWCM